MPLATGSQAPDFTLKSKTADGLKDVVLSAALPAEKASTRDARMAEKKAKAPKGNPKFNAQVGGVFDNRPLDAWAKLAHALFQTNEAIFLN